MDTFQWLLLRGGISETEIPNFMIDLHSFLFGTKQTSEISTLPMLKSKYVPLLEFVENFLSFVGGKDLTVIDSEKIQYLKEITKMSLV